MSDSRIDIRYYVAGELHAGRTRTHVPRVGDEVRLNSGLYRVARVVWIEDHGRSYDESYVAIDLEPVG